MNPKIKCCIKKIAVFTVELILVLLIFLFVVDLNIKNGMLKAIVIFSLGCISGKIGKKIINVFKKTKV